MTRMAVAGAGAHHQAVAQHNGHHQQEGQGGALAAGIRDKGGSVFPRLLIGLQRLGLPLGAAGHEEGGAPDDDGQRDAGGDEVLSVREPSQAGDGDHRGDEGAYIQAGGSGAVENDAQGGRGEPHAGHNGDQDRGDDGVGAGQGAQQGDQQGGGDHGDQNGHLLAFQLEAVDHHVHQVMCHFCLGQDFRQTRAQDDDEADEGTEGAQGGVERVGEAR